MTTTTRQALHVLVDRLDETAVDEALAYLSELALRPGNHRFEESAKVLRPLDVLLATAPYDDEPVTEEEELAVAQARLELARGEGLTRDELRRQLGL